MTDPRTAQLRPLVLASGSRYRRSLLAAAGIEVIAITPDIDERAIDLEFDPTDASVHALRLAHLKASAVRQAAPAHALILAADQLAVSRGALLHQPGNAERAVEQLMSLSGTTHQLVNGIVLVDTDAGTARERIDIHNITMRHFSRGEATVYVEHFEPFDCAGSYRIEDDADLIAAVAGSGDDGVIGLPIGVVREMLAEAGAT